MSDYWPLIAFCAAIALSFAVVVLMDTQWDKSDNRYRACLHSLGGEYSVSLEVRLDRRRRCSKATGYTPDGFWHEGKFYE
jgi:hypothetical protein